MRLEIRTLRLLVVVLSGLIALPQIGRAQNDTITLGPAVMTFSALAEKLSIEGRTVQCATGLRGGAVFVCLRNRSWQKAQSLLGAGLDVRFHTVEGHPNTWLLERDPAVAARETRWRRQFAEYVRDQALKEAAPAAPYLRQSFNQVLEQAISLKIEVEKIRRIDPDLKEPASQELVRRYYYVEGIYADPVGWVCAFFARRVTTEQVLAALSGEQPVQPVDSHQFVNGRAAVSTLTSYLDGLTQTETVTDREAIRADIARFSSNDFRIGFRHRFLLEKMVFRSVAIDGAAREVGRDSLQDSRDVDVELATPELYGMLGVEAAAFEKEARARSANFMAKEPAKQEFDINRTSETTSLSQVVEAWSRQTHGEAVMELAPYREYILLPPRDIIFKNGDVIPAVLRTSLAKFYAARKDIYNDVWACDEQDGVLFVRSQLSFLDRARPLPMGSLLKLEANCTITPDETSGFMTALPLDALVKFHRSIDSSQAAAMDLGETYRGLDIASVVEARPLLLLLGSLSPGNLASVTAQLAKTGKVQIPLTAFAPSRLVDLATELKAHQLNDIGPTDISYRGALLPDFTALLRGWSLTIRWIKRRGASDGLSLSMTIPASKPGGTPENVCEVTIPGLRIGR